MNCERVIFTGHAVGRMFERSVSRDNALAVLVSGETIAEYPDNKPFPSRLLLSVVRGRALHVVVAVDDGRRTCYVVSVYEPDPEVWEEGFRKRRSP